MTCIQASLSKSFIRVRSYSTNRFRVIQPKANFQAIGGYQRVLSQLTDIVSFFRNSQLYSKAGVRPLKGVLLSGPSGVGKSLVAEAVAGEAGVPLLSLSGTEIPEDFQHRNEVLTKLYHKALDISPCVLRIDEFESVCKVNGPILPMLTNDYAGVVTIATTSRFDMINPSLIRFGRFDKHIVIGLPNIGECYQILKMYTSNKVVGANLQDLAWLSHGSTAAEIAGWINDAARIALSERSQIITSKHLDEARCQQLNGIASPIEDLDQRFRVAVHEAGHALVAAALGQRIYKISVLETEAYEGIVEMYPYKTHASLSEEQSLDQICFTLAGRAAETVFGFKTCGFNSDLEAAKSVAEELILEQGMGKNLLGSEEEVDMILENQMKRAVLIIQKSKALVANITEALMERHELFEEDFLQVCRGEQLSKKVK